jgi:predicted RNA binding protein YcfA (HicA-like mRNA interferase family)
MKLPPISGERLIKILSKRGFELKRMKGSHLQLEDKSGRRVTVPVHGGRFIGIVLCERLCAMPKYLEKNYLN